jgi:hypothetical protein
MSTIINKNMPNMSGGTSDRDSSFILGRRAFLNSSHNSHNSQYLAKNLNYDEIKNKKTSILYAKPLQNMGSDLRTQRLRLTTIGGGSLKVKNSNDPVSFTRTDKNGDKNLVNNVLSRVRGTGGYKPKTSNKGCKHPSY